MVDESKLNVFIGKMLGDLGGAFSVPMVRMGDKLGLYKALKEQGPMTPEELAGKTKVPNATRASGCRIKRRPVISISTPQRASSPCRRNRRWCSRTLTAQVYLQGAFDSRWRWWKTRRKSRPHFVQAKASAGAIRRRACSAPWGRFFRPSYHNNLVRSWPPALDGVAAKLERGATSPMSVAGTGF